MPSDDEQRISDLRKAAESFSALQYVVIRTERQWPWTSVTATNQVVDLVRAMPWLLDSLAASQAREARLRDANLRYREAMVRPVPEDVATELGYECLICGWEVDQISADFHEPSCILADETLEALAAAAPAAGGQPCDGRATARRDCDQHQRRDLASGSDESA